MILSKSRMHALAGIFALAIGGGALAQTESVLIKRVAQLRNTPGEASPSIANLPLQTAVTRLGDRQGPWIKVRLADGTQGWVHMFDITAASTAPTSNAGTNALRGITSFFNKGSAQANATSLPTSTIGIRGLGAEDLANSQPNPAAVAQADAARVDENQARQFANAASLTSRTVTPLPVPAAPAGAPAGGSNNQFQGGG